MTDRLEVYGPKKDDARSFVSTMAPGIAVKIGQVEGFLVYELKIPIQASSDLPYAIEAKPGALIGFGLETPKMDKPEGEGAKRHGRHGRHGRARPWDGRPRGWGSRTGGGARRRTAQASENLGDDPVGQPVTRSRRGRHGEPVARQIRTSTPLTRRPRSEANARQ